MQADVQNQGYAAGVAAAWIAKKGCATRELDIKELQKHLVAVGNLPESILRETDNFPLPKERVAEAVRRVANDYDGLEIVLAQFDTAQPLLRQALAAAPEKDRLIYAHILGMMGDAAGAEVLADAVKARPWDQGWRYTGMGQFGPSMSPLDSLLIALGRTRSPVALKPIVEKVGQLGPDSEFSHFRAIAMALETLADKSAAQPLAALLQKPGLGGHAVTTIDAALEANPRSSHGYYDPQPGPERTLPGAGSVSLWRLRRSGRKDPARILARPAWPLRPPRQSGSEARHRAGGVTAPAVRKSASWPALVQRCAGE